MNTADPKVLARFWRYTRKTDGCWEWQSSLSRGYGQMSGGPGRPLIAVHRFSYTLHIGPIPPGLSVCHRCDNRRCANPAHLFLGSPAQNSADMVAKTRQERGERHHAARFTEAEVVAIIAALSAGASQASLAREYRVSEGAICHIAAGRTWRFLPRAPQLRTEARAA